MRKMFEEMRVADEINEFTSDLLFDDDVKGFDGSVHKDEFIYTILNKEEFTLTRSEVSNVCNLLLNINVKDEKAKIDLEQLQYSYSSYLKYYELIEARVIDLLEKFKLSIAKKLETQEEVDNLIPMIDDGMIEVNHNGMQTIISVTDRGRLLIRCICMIFDKYLNNHIKYSKVI